MKTKAYIPFISPPISESDISRAAESLRTGWLVPGEYSLKMEAALSKFLGVEDSYLTSSCTHAIQMALLLAGVGNGDEVITSSLTWVAGPNSILWAGAIPVFVDVDPITYLMTPETCERAITKKTKAIILTHLYGQMCDVEGFRRLADKKGIKIIEDAAHALESDYKGIKPGQLSFAAAFSFHAGKNITSGQGGALVIKSDRKSVLMARRHGVINNNEGLREMNSFGGKFEITDFQAALLIGQIERIEETKIARIGVWNFYEELSKKYHLSFPESHNQGFHAHYQFVVKLENNSKRNKARQILKSLGVETSVHFSPVHRERYYLSKFRGLSLPISEEIGDTIVSLPTHTNVRSPEKKQISDAFENLKSIGLV